jgi:hypothetical protein
MLLSYAHAHGIPCTSYALVACRLPHDRQLDACEVQTFLERVWRDLVRL